MKTDSYCVGGRHRSATKVFYGDITSKCSKVIIGLCPICNRKKSMTVSDNTNQAESLGDFLENLGKKRLSVSKRMAKNVLKNPGRALDITANVTSAVTYKNPKHVLSTLPEVINFYHTGKRLYLWKTV